MTSETNLKWIPHSRPTLGAEEIDAVAAVMATGQIAQGEAVGRFENALAETVGLPEAAAVSSGTAALHLTLVAMGIGAGDEVIVPSYVCTALLNAVRHAGAVPVVADIEPVSLNLSARDAAARMTARTRAVIVPHMFGRPADMVPLMRLNVPIIEDCAQAIGATDQGQAAGTWGHAVIFSFYATKVITAGEGGAVASRSPDLIERIKELRAYDNPNDGSVRYNYKMTDMQAAMGIVQLSRLVGFVRRRQTIARMYDRAFQDLDIGRPADHPGHVYYRYILDVGGDVAPLIESCKTRGIGCMRPVFRPLHRYLNMSGYPATDTAWQNNLSIPIYPSLSDADVKRITEYLIEKIRER